MNPDRHSADDAPEPHGGLAFLRAPRRHDQHAVVVGRADFGVAVAREQRAGLAARRRARCTGTANAKSSVAIVTTSVTSITCCARHAAPARDGRRETPARPCRNGGGSAASPASRRPARRRSQCWPHSISSALRGSLGIVEERVVAQPLAGGVAGVDDDVLAAGRAPARARRPCAAGRPSPAAGSDRSSNAGRAGTRRVVERAQLARAGEIGRAPRAVEHLGGPQSVEILVDAARRERIGA